MNKFIDHLPDKLKENPSTVSFLGLMQAIQELKDTEIAKFVDSYNPYLADNDTLMRLAKDSGQEYISTFTKKQLEGLYIRRGEIYDKKGTKDGLKALLEVLTERDIISIEYTSSYPLLHFTTLKGSILPNGEDLKAEDDGTFVIPTLLGGSWTNYNNSLTITFSGEAFDYQFDTWLKSIIPLYTPDGDDNSLSITFLYQ